MASQTSEKTSKNNIKKCRNAFLKDETLCEEKSLIKDYVSRILKLRMHFIMSLKKEKKREEIEEWVPNGTVIV